MEQFEIWHKQIVETLNKPNNQLTLDVNGKLMQLDVKDGLMKVNYSEALIQLLRDVRQLNELGYKK